MIKGDYDKLNDLARHNVCAEHKTPLEVAWSSQEKSYFLRCGVCEYPEAITRQLSLTQELKAGADIPEPIKSNIEKSMRRRSMTQQKTNQDDRLWLVPKTDLANGQLLPPEAIQRLVDYAKSYGLDPYRGHVVYMYGKPYITLDGYLFYAHLSHRPYDLSSCPMSTEEAANYKIKETDHAWIAKVEFLDSGQTYTGLGIVTYDEMTATSKKDSTQLKAPVVASHPWQLGQKRAEWQALRRAFPIGETPPLSDSHPLIEEKEENRIE